MPAQPFRRFAAFEPPPDPPPAPAAAGQALALLAHDGADGEQIFGAQALNAALHPLRHQPALGVRCGRCDYGIAFLALAQQGAYIVSAN